MLTLGSAWPGRRQTALGNLWTEVDKDIRLAAHMLTDSGWQSGALCDSKMFREIPRVRDDRERRGAETSSRVDGDTEEKQNEKKKNWGFAAEACCAFLFRQLKVQLQLRQLRVQLCPLAEPPEKNPERPENEN